MHVERRPITDSATWHAWRAECITASVIGALKGCHPYVTPLRLHLEKRGVEFPPLDPDNPVLRRGHWLEPSIARVVGQRHPEWTLAPAGVFLCAPELKLGATPDYFIEGDSRGLGVLQCKSVAPSVFERDWSSGEEPPLWIVDQCRTEMMLAGAAFGVVAALVVDPFAMELHTVEVPRDSIPEAALVELVHQFWADVAAGREPAADFGRDSDAIRALTAREVAGKVFDASGSNELPVLLAQRAALVARMKADEERVTEIENEVRLMLGKAESISGLPGWRISFKTVKREGYTVPPKASRQLRIYDRRPAHEQPQPGDI